MKKTYLNWSSGKDAAFALYQVQQENEYSVEKLLTTLNSDFNRISMHGVRRELLIKQTESLGIPLQFMELKEDVTMEDYNDLMSTAAGILLNEGFTHSIFGDIFLEDLREYREKQLSEIGIKAVFPLWKRDTRGIIRDFIDSGFKAIVVCVNAKLLPKSFCGRIIDKDFLEALPEGVDPCGENGEFHTFVFDGPIFKKPVNFQVGEKVERSYGQKEDESDNCFSDEEKSWDTRFWYCDLIL